MKQIIIWMLYKNDIYSNLFLTDLRLALFNFHSNKEIFGVLKVDGNKRCKGKKR